MEPQYLDDLAALNKDGGDYVRLLRVHSPSSRPKEATLCELQVFSLRTAPRYSALSYCRQPESGIVNIDVRGSVKGSFPVSHDLRAAMRAVHHHRRSDWFWIDAICINQSSNDEKNDQVPRMREIYEMAYAGLIWLGTAVTRDQAGSVHLENETNCAPPRKVISPPGSREDRNGNLGLTREKVIQLFKLSERRRAWWCRTWVIQEMVLPTRLYVCVGLQLMRWDQLVIACNDWRMFDYHHVSAANACLLKLKRLDRLRKQWQIAKYSLDILELLDEGTESYATDARDIVYGVLGLASPQDKHHIRVDYDRTVGQVYAEVTAMLINKRQSMDVIAKSLKRGTEKSQPGLPSWVVDYGSGSYGHKRTSLFGPRVSLGWYIGDHGYKAGGETTPSTSNDENALKLHMEAVFFDTVIETFETDQSLSVEEGRPTYKNEEKALAGGTVHVPQWLQSWLLAAATLLQSSSERTWPPSDPRHVLQRSKDIVRGLAQADIFPEFTKYMHYRSTKENNDMLVEVLSSIGNLTDEPVREPLWSRHFDYKRFIFDINDSAQDTLFVTESGFAGWARRAFRQSSCELRPCSDRSVCKDDIVVVPRGASMPWVLRKTGIEGEYKLITDCAVYGIMYGELMSLVESGQLQTQRFTLV